MIHNSKTPSDFRVSKLPFRTNRKSKRADGKYRFERIWKPGSTLVKGMAPELAAVDRYDICVIRPNNAGFLVSD